MPTAPPRPANETQNASQQDTDTVGIGMIGCGGRLRNVIGSILARSDRLRITALCDPSEQSINVTREAFAGDAPATGDYHELIQRSDVDWVAIGTPNLHHAQQTIAAFEAGKHVFCEKPLAITTQQCIDVRDAWKASGKKFIIGFTLRYSPHFRKIKQIIDSGEIGKLLSIEGNELLDFAHGGRIMSDWRRLREASGGHMLEKCCHDIDLLNWFIGSLPVKVASFGGNDFFLPENAHYLDKVGTVPDPERSAYLTSPRSGPNDPFRGEHDIVDNQVAILEYANHVRVTFHTNLHSGIKERRTLFVGTDGAMRSDILSGRLEIGRIGQDQTIHEYQPGGEGGHGGGDQVLDREMADVMLGQGEPAASVEEGLASAITCFAIDQAMLTGSVVDVRPTWEQAGVAV